MSVQHSLKHIQFSTLSLSLSLSFSKKGKNNEGSKSLLHQLKGKEDTLAWSALSILNQGKGRTSEDLGLEGDKFKV